MTTTSASAINEHFKSLKCELTLWPEPHKRKFDSIEDLIKFLDGEIKFWSGKDEAVCERFRSSKRTLEDQLKPQSHFHQNVISSVLSILSNARSSATSSNDYCIYSSTAAASYLADIKKNRPHLYDGAKEFLVLKELSIPHHPVNGPRRILKDFFMGMLDAYYFSSMQENIKGFVKGQETSLAEIQSRFNVLFNDCSKHAEDNKKAMQDDVKTRDQLHGETKDGFAKLQNELREEFSSKMKEWEAKFADTEKVFREKITLDAPVQYWDELSKKHLKTGRLTSVAACIVTFFFILLLAIILYDCPFTILNSVTWSLASVKGSLILLTITSIGLYIIHLLAKFAISSYHLSRDAEERKQLTHVFLALLENKAVESSSHREIILQALFSRADTGLLKGDHAPVMPCLSGALDATRDK